MSQVTQFLIELIQTLFERYGYPVVFFGTFLENALFLGLFVPGVFVLLLAGLAARDGLIDVRIAMAVAILGTSMGDTISYIAGRVGWRRALDRAEQLPFMGTVRSALLRRTGLFVLAYHFLGYTRLLGPVTAGALRIPFRRWYFLDALGATAWVAVFMLAGYALGGVISLETLNENVKVVDRILLVGAIITISVVVALRLRAERRRRAAAQSTADEPVEETSSTPLP